MQQACVEAFVDTRGTYFSRMFWYWFRAGPRMLKATQPRAGTKRVATIAALLSPAAATSAIWLAASACINKELAVLRYVKPFQVESSGGQGIAEAEAFPKDSQGFQTDMEVSSCLPVVPIGVRQRPVQGQWQRSCSRQVTWVGCQSKVMASVLKQEWLRTKLTSAACFGTGSGQAPGC